MPVITVGLTTNKQGTLTAAASPEILTVTPGAKVAVTFRLGNVGSIGPSGAQFSTVLITGWDPGATPTSVNASTWIAADTLAITTSQTFTCNVAIVVNGIIYKHDPEIINSPPKTT